MRTVFPYQFEEELKAQFFAPSRKGFFVEVGADEPQRGSQSWAPRVGAGWLQLARKYYFALPIRMLRDRKRRLRDRIRLGARASLGRLS